MENIKNINNRTLPKGFNLFRIEKYFFGIKSHFRKWPTPTAFLIWILLFIKKMAYAEVSFAGSSFGIQSNN